MPNIEVNGTTLYYEDSGAGSETILFSHGLLMSCRMFDDQVAAFKDQYRCVAYDHRGQGKSAIAASGYDMETLYEDAAALIEKLKIAPCHFVGLSMGGFIGMRLAARKPHLIKSLVLMETSADPEPEQNVPRYRRLNFVAKWFGFSIVTGRVMPIMFGQKFLNDSSRTQPRETWKQRMINNDRTGTTRAVQGVIDRKPIYDEIHKITAPTLIMVGDQDVATVPAKSERMRDRIPGSKMVIIPGAGHSATVEEPAFVNARLKAFLSGKP